jgi:hypothetical protein
MLAACALKICTLSLHGSSALDTVQTVAEADACNSHIPTLMLIDVSEDED